MLRLFMDDGTVLEDMCRNIIRNKSLGIYDGAYEVVKIAMGMRDKKGD